MKTDPLFEHCRALPGSIEDIKWGKDLIFSVGGKMFAGFQLPDGEPIGFKVEPAVFDAPVAKVRAAVRAVKSQKPESSLVVTKQHQIFAENLDPQRRASRR